MEQRLGILGGMGPQATQDFYQRILGGLRPHAAQNAETLLHYFTFSIQEAYQPT